MRLLILLLLSSFALAAPMSEQAFTEYMFEQLQQHNSESEFELAGNLHITRKTPTAFQIYLDNAYLQYANDPTELDAIVADRITLSNYDALDGDTQPLTQILPVIKPVDYIEQVRQQLSQADIEQSEPTLPFYYTELNSDLVQLYVFDSPESMQFVTPKNVKERDIANTISEIAHSNLQRYYQQFGANWQEVDPGLYLFAVDEIYEASIILALKQFPITALEQPVIFIPARNIALAANLTDEKALWMAQQIAVQGYQELAYSISPHGYVWQDNQWQRFKW